MKLIEMLKDARNNDAMCTEARNCVAEQEIGGSGRYQMTWGTHNYCTLGEKKECPLKGTSDRSLMKCLGADYIRELSSEELVGKKYWQRP